MRTTRAWCLGAAASLGLLAPAPSTAADYAAGPGYGRAPHPARYAPPRGRALVLAPVGTACREDGNDTLLGCVPEIEVVPPREDLVVWNELQGLRSRYPRPHTQLFDWTP